jgi:hypothetical protein
MLNANWFWFILGAAFALFVLPMIQAYFASRKQGA